MVSITVARGSDKAWPVEWPVAWPVVVAAWPVVLLAPAVAIGHHGLLLLWQCGMACCCCCNRPVAAAAWPAPVQVVAWLVAAAAVAWPAASVATGLLLLTARSLSGSSPTPGPPEPQRPIRRLPGTAAPAARQRPPQRPSSFTDQARTCPGWPGSGPDAPAGPRVRSSPGPPARPARASKSSDGPSPRAPGPDIARAPPLEAEGSQSGFCVHTRCSTAMRRRIRAADIRLVVPLLSSPPPSPAPRPPPAHVGRVAARAAAQKPPATPHPPLPRPRAPRGRARPPRNPSGPPGSEPPELSLKSRTLKSGGHRQRFASWRRSASFETLDGLSRRS